MSRFYKRLSVLTLTLFLPALASAGPWSSIDGLRRNSPTGASLQPLAALESWLQALWAEVGCSLDPNGCPGSGQTPGTPQGESEIGCSLDPSGSNCTKRR